MFRNSPIVRRICIVLALAVMPSYRQESIPGAGRDSDLAHVSTAPIAVIAAGPGAPHAPPRQDSAFRTIPAISLREARSTGPFVTLAFTDEAGMQHRYRAGRVLARFKSESEPVIFKVIPGREPELRQALLKSPAVAYAELDMILTRQAIPNDPLFTNQWHHAKLGSADAWQISKGDSNAVTIAIIDSPFQMNHPDLAAHAVPGWDIIRDLPITSDPTGFYHSTIGAGIAAAVISNGVGVAGVVNARLMPIDIGDEPSLSDMHAAITWAADHGVRIVNASWDGANSSLLNDAGQYLREKTGGMLFMSGINSPVPLSYPNHPYLYAIAMTDRADQPRSASGNHIDFSAPGWEIYSTTTNSGYEIDSGTSYSAPLVAGIAAWIMSLNTNLPPEEIAAILQTTAVDLGAEGWDSRYGWGRIDFAAVAQATFATLPMSRISINPAFPPQVTAEYEPGARYRLYRSEALASPSWQWISPVVATNQNRIQFTDPIPPEQSAFYRLLIELPR